MPPTLEQQKEFDLNHAISAAIVDVICVGEPPMTGGKTISEVVAALKELRPQFDSFRVEAVMRTMIKTWSMYVVNETAPESEWRYRMMQ